MGQETTEPARTGYISLLLLVWIITTVALAWRLFAAIAVVIGVILLIPVVLSGGRLRGFGFTKIIGVAAIASRRRERNSYPVHHFRVDVAGRTVQCVMEGHLDGGFVELGDRVDASGRWHSRSGVFRTRRVRNLTSHAIVRGRVPWRVTANRYAGYILGVGAVAGLLWALVTGLGR